MITEYIQKPVVNYNPFKGYDIAVGRPAFIYPINHPDLSNTQYAITSKVIKYDEVSGEFETENTHYVPVDPEADQHSCASGCSMCGC